MFKHFAIKESMKFEFREAFNVFNNPGVAATDGERPLPG